MPALVFQYMAMCYGIEMEARDTVIAFNANWYPKHTRELRKRGTHTEIYKYTLGLDVRRCK